ncbi:alcohol dehydrogenase catalytic domain-containing protein [Myxococcota bacterium]|nr:alcohol dehydrogenase catalytic domain-containing protein [Myxococcota bacterium]MBU1430925.1 alcohol dehydrogenase catalytic domain-containing protein [Myxococcota bacterium]MBU1898322.1 alcohol dehydrogenase catalytic domain-containing protein [Myxococcota bacterium]
MRALIRSQGVRLAARPTPQPAPGEARIKVAFAGLCRTDLQVADGLIPVAEPRVLGHEFSGWIDALGAGVEGLRVGQPVAVMPLLPCGACFGCRHARPCAAPRLLGVDRDGAFADHITLPAAAIYPIPEDLPLRRAAFAEPLAAALAVLEAGLERGERGAVYGQGRIAALTLRVLRHAGFERVEPVEDAASLGLDAYDFIVETRLDAAAWPLLIAATRPQGRLVLKSRATGAIQIDPLAAIQKHLTLKAVYYGAFPEALRLLRGGLEVDDLLATPRPLEEHAAVFEAARLGETTKPLFAL